MSEYWVSHKKYFCKYCNIYIADDAPSRSQHEGGLRHKGNVERFVRGLYKAGEKRKQDLEEEKRDMARVEQAAQAAFARDVGDGLVKPGSSSSASAPPKPTAPSKPPRKPSNPYEDYSTAESLGYTDPDAERMKAEAERRRMQGVAGEWQIISTDVSIPHPEDNKAQVEGQPAPTVDGNRKREAEVVIDDDDGRIFKLRKKKLGVGLGEIYDPGLIPIKLKVKKEEQADTDGLTSIGHQAASGEAKASSTSTAAPKWTARGWTKPSDVQSNQTPTSGDSSAPHDVSQVSPPTREDLPLHTPVAEALVDVKSTISSDSPPIPAVKVESDTVKGEEGETPAPAGGMFRKRKIPGGGNRGRR